MNALFHDEKWAGKSILTSEVAKKTCFMIANVARGTSASLQYFCIFRESTAEKYQSIMIILSSRSEVDRNRKYTTFSLVGKGIFQRKAGTKMIVEWRKGRGRA